MQMIYTERTESMSVVPFQRLGIAVIKQAAEDYRAAARKLESIKNGYEKLGLEKEMESIRRFFLGEWYEILSSVGNGPMILEMLDREGYGT